jgi:hypothetical protein
MDDPSDGQRAPALAMRLAVSSRFLPAASALLISRTDRSNMGVLPND